MTPIRTSFTLALALLSVSSAWAADDKPQKQAYVQSTARLDGFVRSAEEGVITPQQLRSQRRRVEARLNQVLSDAPIELKPGDLHEIAAARCEMNQSVIRSQEFEFFGSEDRPEWGWFPSKEIASTGSTLTVSKDGRSHYSALR